MALEGCAFSGVHISVFPGPRESAPQHPARQAQPWLMLNLPGKPAHHHSSLKALGDSRVLHRTGASKNFMRQPVCPRLPGPLQKGEQFRQLWSQRRKKVFPHPVLLKKPRHEGPQAMLTWSRAISAQGFKLLHNHEQNPWPSRFTATDLSTADQEWHVTCTFCCCFVLFYFYLNF